MRFHALTTPSGAASRADGVVSVVFSLGSGKGQRPVVAMLAPRTRSKFDIPDGDFDLLVEAGFLFLETS